MACNRILIRHAFFSFDRGQAHTIISQKLTQLKCQMPEEQTGDFDELHLDFDAIANCIGINSVPFIVWHMVKLIEMVGSDDGKWEKLQHTPRSSLC